MSDREDILTSAFGRAMALGGLAGRLGTSWFGTKLRLPFLDDLAKTELVQKVYVREAERLVERLGSMKGAAMKFGQMLSIHGAEGFLPPEVTQILSALQKDAQPIAYRPKIEAALRAELGDNFALLESIDETAFASASIGQVHRGRMRDGREIALKIQFPDMPRVVTSDIRNLKILAAPLLMILGVRDVEPIWQELEDRLHEELDYEAEARHIKKMAALHRDNDRVIIPEVIDELSGPRVLAMSFEPGLDDATSSGYSQELRDRWGRVIVETTLENLLIHRFLHADPNPGNFAYREDGRIVLYDFGCVKTVPDRLAAAYGRMARALLERRYGDVPEIVKDAGIHMRDGSPLSVNFVKDHAFLFEQPFGGGSYRFGSDPELGDRLMRLAGDYWYESLGIVFPADILMVHRTFAGTSGNLARLGASGDWRDVLDGYLARAGF